MVITNFIPKNLSKNDPIESISLLDWSHTHPDMEELRDVFLNMDRALRYIHEHKYCIQDFRPDKIEILNNEVDHIQFKKIMELSSDPITARQMIQEDIFLSALVQIALYLHIDDLDHINIDFLKESFDEVAKLLPEGDVPYYRGVIQRGAGVYYSEYAFERRKQELEELESELGEESQGMVVPFKESKSQLTNSKVNDMIYKQINGLKEAAFVNLLLIPTIILTVLFLVGLFSWIFSLF